MNEIWKEVRQFAIEFHEAYPFAIPGILVAVIIIGMAL